MKNFKGFSTPDKFTQMPNEYLEYTYSHDCDLTLVDMKIMNFFFRNTFGWVGKQQYSMVLSLNEIQTIINVKNRNQVSNSLSKLTEKNFLEKKLVSKLTKKQRLNIEKALDKKLKSNQVLYRLHLEDNPLPWDIVVNMELQVGKEKIHEMKESFNTKKTSIKSDTSIKNDTGTSIKSDTDVSIKSDTSAEAETLDTVSADDLLNKGLNKELNKTSSSSDARELIDQELKEKYPHVPFEEVKEELLNDETAIVETNKQYKSMLEYRLKNWKSKKTSKSSSNKNRKTINTEKHPDWFADDEYQFRYNISHKKLAELMLMTEELKDYPQQLEWLQDRIREVEIRENRTLTVEAARIEIQEKPKQEEIEFMLQKLRA